jgi:hypothetical protein
MRPAELDDANWLARAYRSHGDQRIAAELGVARGTVRSARERLGIVSAPPGPRRGAPPRPSRMAVVSSVLAPGATSVTATLIAERFERESLPGGPPPTQALLAARLRAAAEAHSHDDDAALDDALISIAAACGLIYEHRRKLHANGLAD